MSRLANIVASFFLQAPMDDGSVLDVGVGAGTFGLTLSAVRRVNKPYLVGLDVYAPYLKMVPMNIYDDVVQGDASKLPFRDKAFSSVVSIAVLEHLEKKAAESMLDEMERVAKSLVAIMTSWGSIPKHGDENPWQEHRSAWHVSDFKHRGYKVRFLPDFSKPIWTLVPFVLTYIFGLNAKLLLAFKYLKKPDPLG